MSAKYRIPDNDRQETVLVDIWYSYKSIKFLFVQSMGSTIDSVLNISWSVRHVK